MKIKALSSITLIVTLISIVSLSCVKDVDFNQAESLTLSPIIDASLIYFEEPASTFVDDNGVEQQVIIDSVRIEILNDDFVIDNLVRADFLFEATNTINRAYEAQIDFLNDTNDLQHTFTFSVANSPNNEDVVVEHLEIFENNLLIGLKATTKLILTLTLQPSTDGSVLMDTSPGNLKLRSKATFYLNIDTSS